MLPQVVQCQGIRAVMIIKDTVFKRYWLSRCFNLVSGILHIESRKPEIQLDRLLMLSWFLVISIITGSPERLKHSVFVATLEAGNRTGRNSYVWLEPILKEPRKIELLRINSHSEMITCILVSMFLVNQSIYKFLIDTKMKHIFYGINFKAIDPYILSLIFVLS